MRQLKLTVQTTNKQEGPLDILQAGIKSYYHRISPELMLSPSNVIVDSLEEVSEWIASNVAFVAKLAGDNSLRCPFHFDATFAFNKSREIGSVVGTTSNGDDEEDVDDEEDDD